MVSIQNPIKWEGNEPEPDIAICNSAPRLTPQHCHLVIEVSETTLEFDQKTKVPLYHSVGLPVLIVNLPDRRFERYDLDAKMIQSLQTEIMGIEVTIDELV